MFLTAIAVGIGVRFGLLAAPPLFLTDVYYYNSQALGYLLHLVDPYGAAYSVPAALATPGAANVFAYLPGLFAFIAPAGALWGTALGLVAADLVVGACLALLQERNRGLYSSLYLLFPPVVLFSTCFLNDALPAMAFLSVAVLLESRRRPLPAALFWGLAFASSQEAWFVFPVYAAYVLRNRRYRALAISVATAAVVAAPFVAWNPSAFFQDAVLFQFQRQAVSLVTPGPFGLNINPSLQGVLLAFGASAPLWARGSLAALAMALTLWKSGKDLPGLMLASAGSTSVLLFLLGGELFWSYFELPFVMLLAWLALRGLERGASTLKEQAEGSTLSG